MVINKISPKDTSILKAVAIITIVLHNALHPLYRPLVVCNEFSFSIDTIRLFIKQVSENIFSLPSAFFIVFGYIGVSVFFFLSAYGLAKKFFEDDKIQYIPFVKSRLIKLYVPIAISCIVLLLMIFLFGEYSGFANIDKINYFLRLSMLSNFNASRVFVIVGPWWFLGAVFQLYLVFHFLVWGFKKYSTPFLVIISAASIVFMMFFNNYFLDHIILRTNIIAWIPEVALGVYLAQGSDISVSKVKGTLLAVLGLTVFILGNFFEFFWYFSSFAALTFLVFLFRPILSIAYASDRLESFLNYTGKISVYMFLVNGILREPVVAYFKGSIPPWWQQDLIAVFLLILTFCVSALLMAFQKKLFRFS